MKTTMMARWLGLMIVLIQLRTSAVLAQTDVKAVAREHFEKGVAAFNDKRFGEAALEFDTAYKLSPASVVLYNIGQVNVLLGRSVEAVEAFEKYLADGAASIPPERQAEVRAEIEKQRAQIGTVAITTQPIGAEVRVDGRLVGKTPLARPMSVTAGRHTIEAQLPRYTPEARDLDVTGKARIEIELKLKPVLVIVKEPAAPPSVLPAAPTPTTNATSMVSPGSQAPSVVEVTPRSDEDTSPDWRRRSGYALAGIGLAAAIAGGIVGIVSAGDANDARNRAISAADAKPTTMKDVNNYAQAKADFDSAKNHNQIGWTVAGIGAAVLAGGVVLVLTAPEHKTSVGLTGLAPFLTACAGGLAMEGAW